MTTTDAKDPQAWKQAEDLARADAGGPVHKRSDDLPFLFFTDEGRYILVHKGAVVKAKGPAVIGAYLRDLGVIDGKGPGIEDVALLLEVFEALPPITEVQPTSYVVADNTLTSRIDHDGTTGRVVLNYIVGEGPAPRGDEQGAPVKLIAIATLEIPKTGEPAWKPIEKSTWSP